MPQRMNSKGYNLDDLTTLFDFQQHIESHANTEYIAESLIPGYQSSNSRQVFSPALLTQRIGSYAEADDSAVEMAISNARVAFKDWKSTDPKVRIKYTNDLSDAIEAHTPELIYLLRHEAGKTLQDCVSEVREAVDFCRYYAAHAETLLCTDQLMPGPTGETNVLTHESKGLFVCISPWNFPLAIYVGQIIAALVTGNCVIAKPAEQTSLIAYKLAQLIHQCGFGTSVFQLLIGKGSTVGNALCQHPKVDGVVFTGSTQTARIINRNLANREEAAIATFIAETGGQNCMIADSSTLPEQLVKDVIQSAFMSAGQRCSALRVLYVQEDIADKVLGMLKGAMQELTLGHPARFDTDVSTLIDQQAKQTLTQHAAQILEHGTLINAMDPIDLDGYYFPPHAVEIQSIEVLQKEIFGPFLHVIRYAAGDLDTVIEQINQTGYGLTCGIHSRIDTSIEYIAQRIRVGNCYINRNIIGAVVGVQPFGGMGLSGTGPKAGGPDYLKSFVTEKTYTNNISAVGGNADLLELNED